MKTIQILLAVAIASGIFDSCNAQADKNDQSYKVAKPEKVEVFYFHFTRRCATCKAVESVSKDAIRELYGEQVGFEEYNLDEASGKAKGGQLGISGQTLLIIAGDTKIDITNEGFMNARSNPEKLKQIIKEKIDPLL